MDFFLPVQEEPTSRKPVLHSHAPFEHSKLGAESQTDASELQSAPGAAEI